MWSKHEKLALRILFIPVSGFFSLQLFALFGNSLNALIYNLTEKTGDPLYLSFETREKVILWFSLFWIGSLFFLELSTAFRKNFKFRWLLTNLRYAPVVILFFSTAVVMIFDLGMIEYSKWQIRNYLFSDSQIIEKPEISLHNNYRHWCGNGFSARENYLYFETASAGFNDENPFVRSRSLLMAARVQDWLNGGDRRFANFLVKSCQDSDETVRATVERYLNAENSGCQKLLSKK